MSILRQRAMAAGLAVLTAGFVGASPVLAVPVLCTGTCAPVVTATVASGLTFSVTIVSLVAAPGGGTTLGSAVTAMNFGSLASNGTFIPPGSTTPQLRSLNSTAAFQVFFGINAQQRPFTISQSSSGTGLASGTNFIPTGAFIVTPLQGVGGDPTLPLPAGIAVSPRGSAIGTGITLFSRTVTGPSATLAATYGITDDTTLGATQPIPLDQPAGTYATTITFSATVI